MGSNGKSVFIDTLTNLCGSENACSISLNSLSKEYYILDLFEKMINISSETPHKKMINTDVVKAVVAGDWVTGRKPYKGPSKFKPFAKHYLAMNDYPLIDDASHGMWRRIYIINFPRKFTEAEMDVHLTEKLKQELSGIFNWAIEGYKRLRKRDFKFSEGKAMRKSKKQYKNQSNSALNFASQYLQVSDSENSIKLKDLYNFYEKFCEIEGYKNKYSKPTFRKILEDGGFTFKYSEKHSNQLRIFGVKVKSMNELR
jgi:putative DNA primase/helicase